jgi:FlaA1/EpsC-like NDP-sugar epimerase
MEWLRNYMIRKRDQATVSYSRFGRQGEETEDRPPPSQIMIAPFNEDDPQFKVLGYWHVERASVTLSAFGMCMVILLFISSFFEFNWYHHQRGVDISALLGLFAYLAIGVLIHYYVLYGIKKQTAYYLLPFIVIYSVVLTGEAVALIGLIVKMVEPEEANEHAPFAGMFVSLLIIAVAQLFMLSTVLRCRQYLSLKETHVLELQVAEKGKNQNPDMEIVVVGEGRNNFAPVASDVEAASHASTPADPVMSADNPIYDRNN